MKILDWNVCAFSKKQHISISKALDFNADIICLQEVTETSLGTLSKVPNYYLVETKDNESKKGGSHLVILSKYKVLDSGLVRYYDKPIKSLATRIISKRTKESEKHLALFADLVSNNQTVRVYNLHISWPVGPSVRIEQFTRFLDTIKHQSHTKIICGDLNVFGSLWFYNLLTFVPFGYKFSDLFLAERKWFDKKFEEIKMQNPLKNTISWPLLPFNAQLDHILIPNDFVIESMFQSKKRYGSDHTPYIVDVKI
jgi:endonuclease/exonuclease/phosphatase family metal-dependent hydrolase